MPYSLAQARSQVELQIKLATAERRKLQAALEDHGTSNWNDQLLLQQLTAKLERLAAAQQRDRNGRLGICECCGQPISLERLEALPDAATCVSCRNQAVAHHLRRNEHTRQAAVVN